MLPNEVAKFVKNSLNPINTISNYKNVEPETTSQKICMVVQSHYPADTRVRREAEALDQAGYSIDIICMKNALEASEYIYGKIMVYRILEDQSKEKLINYLFLSLKFLIKAYRKLNFLSIINKYNLIQVHNLPDYLVFSTIKQKLKKTPILLDLHDLTPELFKSKCYGKKHFFLFLLNLMIEKISCSFANHVITTSTGFVNALLSRGIKKNKVDLIINFPLKSIVRSLPLNFQQTISSGLKIVYHSTVAKRFGLHIPIISMKSIATKIPGSILHIYGIYDETYRDELNELITKLGLEDCVHLFDSLPLELIIPKIQEYHLGPVPYIASEFMQLAISTKSFEYAILKIPMVAADLKPQRYYFNDECVSYFKPGDTDDLTEKVVELCLTPNLMEKKANKAFEMIKEFSDGKTEKHYVNLVDNLIAKNKIYCAQYSLRKTNS